MKAHEKPRIVLNPRDEEYTLPPSHISAANLAELAGCTIVTVHNRCKDCKHAWQGTYGARSVTCQYERGSCWDKMSKACEHFTPKEP